PADLDARCRLILGLVAKLVESYERSRDKRDSNYQPQTFADNLPEPSQLDVFRFCKTRVHIRISPGRWIGGLVRRGQVAEGDFRRKNVGVMFLVVHELFSLTESQLSRRHTRG